MMRLCFLQLCLSAALYAAEPTVPPDVTRTVVTVRADASGRLVRRVVVQPRVVAPIVVKDARAEETAQPSAKLADDASVNEIIDHTAKRYDVDPLLVHSVIQVESGYNKYAVSHAGAQGMMQLIPSTARSLGVKNPFDAKENIEAGVRYLKQLQTTFKDDRLALAAYNAGPGAVAKYGTIPPYSETQNYVYQVGKRLGNARRAQQQVTPAAPKTEQLAKTIVQYVDSEGRLHLQLR
jgi:soluble lytic murein transglycosylase-like protein